MKEDGQKSHQFSHSFLPKCSPPQKRDEDCAVEKDIIIIIIIIQTLLLLLSLEETDAFTTKSISSTK
jgi:hypothetical protein